MGVGIRDCIGVDDLFWGLLLFIFIPLGKKIGSMLGDILLWESPVKNKDSVYWNFLK